MVRINKRGRPVELTDEVRKRLTQDYKKDKKRKVWKKPYIEKALMESSHRKCCYCECRLGQEGKNMQVEHFYPQSIYPEDVVNWDNLLPSCGRCNRKKWDHDTKKDPIIDPSRREPREHLFMRSYRLYPKDDLGKSTIDVLVLNDRTHLVVPRFEIGEQAHETIKKILDLAREYDNGTAKHIRRKNRIVTSTESLIRQGLPEAEYAATVATQITGNPEFCELRQILQRNHLWDDEIKELFSRMAQNSLREK